MMCYTSQTINIYFTYSPYHVKFNCKNIFIRRRTHMEQYNDFQKAKENIHKINNPIYIMLLSVLLLYISIPYDAIITFRCKMKVI